MRMPLALALIALAATPAAAQQDAPTMGRSLSTLAQVPLKSRDGARVLLGSRVKRGKPTLIAFWASWCMPCFAEAPALDRLRKELGGGFNFLYVNRREGDPDPDQPAPAIAKFLTHGGMADLDYLIADVPAYRRILGPDFGTIPAGLVGIPRIYLFDRNGREIYTSLGFRDEEALQLERLLKKAVAER